MSTFHPLTIQKITKETSDAVSVLFDIPTNLKENFSFVAGQYITIKKELDGKEVRRAYSICASPNSKQLQVAIKAVDGGYFSVFATTKLKEGDVLEVAEPEGKFVLNPEASKNYIAFAAGSGITPMLSIIKTHLKLEPDCTFKLFYLNRTAKSIIFKEEIEQLKNSYFQRFHTFHFLTKEQRDIEFLNGRFTPDKLKILTDTFIDIEDTAH